MIIYEGKTIITYLGMNITVLICVVLAKHSTQLMFLLLVVYWLP